MSPSPKLGGARACLDRTADDTDADTDADADDSDRAGDARQLTSSGLAFAAADRVAEAAESSRVDDAAPCGKSSGVVDAADDNNGAADRVGVDDGATALRNGGGAFPPVRTRHNRMRKLGVADGTKGSAHAAVAATVGDELDETDGDMDGTGSTSERPDGNRKGSKRRDTSDADNDEALVVRLGALSGGGGGGGGSARDIGDRPTCLCAITLGSTWWTLTTLPNALVFDSRNKNFAPFWRHSG
jgi:hypothetical protein